MIPYTDYTVRLGDLKRAIVKNPYDPNLNIDGYMRYLKYNTPPAQSERNTAEWVYGEKDGADGWYCSKCGFHIPWDYDYYGLNNIDFIRDFHTCPHCDAKMLKYTGMDGEENG